MGPQSGAMRGSWPSAVQEAEMKAQHERRGRAKEAPPPEDVAKALAGETALAPTTDVGMDAFQEQLNAWSMIFPALLCVAYWQQHKEDEVDPEHDLLVVIMMTSTLAHLPFSFAYHLWCALNPEKERVRGNVFRMLDQTFIHLACIGYTLSLSGSYSYTGICAVYNVWGIRKLWEPENTGAERQRNIFFGAVAYLVPILFVQGIRPYLVCQMAFIAAVYPFGTRVFGGYSQAIFHLLCIPYQYCLLHAVAPSISGDAALMGFVSDVAV